MTKGPNKERLLLWVEALESGNYQQGRGHLRYTDEETEQTTHCCLGVAAEVCERNGGAKFVNPGGAFLHFEAQEWYGLGRYAYNPNLETEDGDLLSATTLNDSKGFDFPTIAAAIRRTFDLGEKVAA